MATGRSHPVRRVRPPFGRAFQSNPAGPARQPREVRFFSELRRDRRAVNSFKLRRLAPDRQGADSNVFAATSRHVTVRTTALKDISPLNPRQGLVAFSGA